MKNVFLILKRDLLRLVRAPAALIVVIALIAIPSLYTWVNVFGFWNPYNNTQNMKVCFVTQDEGGSNTLTGDINLGNMIEQTLRDNTQLGWEFVSFEEAMSEVEQGEAFAAYVVPSDFTKNLLTLFSSNFTSPNILYYVNEKTGPVSPKITDAGSTTLDETINSTFVKTVSKTVVDKLNEAITKANSALDEKDEKVVEKIENATQALSNFKTSLDSLEVSITDVEGKIEGSKQKLDDVQRFANDAENKLANIAENADKVAIEVNNFITRTTQSVNGSVIKMNEATSDTNIAISKFSADLQSSLVSVTSALERQKLELSDAESIIKRLKQISETLPEGDILDSVKASIGKLEDEVTKTQSFINDFETMTKDISSYASKISSNSSKISLSLQNLTTSALNLNTTLLTITLPSLNHLLSSVSTNSAQLASSLKNQDLITSEINIILDQISESLSSSKKSISATKTSISLFEDDLSNLSSDISSLSIGTILNNVIKNGYLDSSAIGEFISSPTVIEQKATYELNAYGSAMAPLFMNLTFWIGAFMLLVIIKQEVDDEKTLNLTIGQRYVSRLLLLSIFSILQAVLCVFGVLIIGVQCANLFLLFLISCMCSASYLSLMFMLSCTLQHIGKGICVLLAFLQIPGATGLYPIEMTTPFFLQVYPLFPFTYGINGLREAIFGLYGNAYLNCFLVLFAIAIISTLIGVYIRPYLTNFNKLFAKEVREGGLFVGEEIEIPTHRFRLSQLLGFLANRKEYSDALKRRATKFYLNYSAFKRYALVLGIVLSVIMAFVFSNFPVEDKPTILTFWLLSLIAISIVVVAVEHAYDSMERQINLDDLSDEDIKQLLLQRNLLGKTTFELFEEQRIRSAKHRMYQNINKQIKCSKSRPKHLQRTEDETLEEANSKNE